METLFRNQTTPSDGPAAIVLIPTRELAMQIFSVVQRVGKYHVFSVGLLIGGQRDFYTEQEHIASTNILIATPGRLLQHLEQTVNLDMSELRVLVLDEADRILDLGFRDQLMRILDYLPNNNNNDHMNNNNHQSLHQQQQQYPQRQTMLFSATQTRNVQSLATLSLRESPEYLGVHDAEQTETPALLQQSYVVVPVEHKLDAIYSFIKSHLKGKSIVFLSTCAQVRHAHDLLCHLRPGIPVVALHGKLSQERRTQIYLEYTQRTTAAILLATDLAARGLDFPNMDWVVQADAPEDAAMYIHRAGRTARYRSGGKSLLMVTPGEERRGLIDLVVQGGKGGSSGQKGSNDRSGSSGNSGSGKQGAAPKVPIKKLRINPTKATIVTDRSASIVASNVQLNTLAKKAFQSYVRSITLMPHKELFAVEDLDLDAFAKSLGLAATPNLRFLEKAAADRTAFRENKNVNKKLQRLKEQIKAEKLQKKIERLGKQGPASVGKDANVNQLDESDEELLVPKQKRQPLDDNNADDNDDDLPIATQARVSKKIKIDGLFGAGKNHVVFNDHGEVEDFTTMLKPVEAEPQDKHELETATANYLDTVRARLSDTKQRDTADQKERIRQKHKKQRLSEKGTKPNDSPALAILGGFDDDQSNSLNDDGSSADDTTDATSSSSDGDAEPDMKQQEDLVLALIRGNKS